ncbi:hypothetical protein PAHAL_1G099700 [Panicum hallii]|jgi:hypothetical protein|uniref:Uncharacterized protein n=1 Tax=Panicum hallii TaxID=206008 RepID=A0A2T8KUQ7_9POAL|nr:hypothetical protein PAHAL_1G099700 [Panicum hallii]
MGFKPLELELIVSGRFLSLSDLGSSTAASTSTGRGGGEEARKEMTASLLLGHLHRSGTQLEGGMGVVFAGRTQRASRGHHVDGGGAVEPVATAGHAACCRTRRGGDTGSKVSGIAPTNLTCGDKGKSDSSSCT